MKTVCELATDLHVHSLFGKETSHLVFRHGKSLLIDCHAAYLLTFNALPYLRSLVPSGDLNTAFFRPGFPRWLHLEGNECRGVSR